MMALRLRTKILRFLIPSRTILGTFKRLAVKDSRLSRKLPLVIFFYVFALLLQTLIYALRQSNARCRSGYPQAPIKRLDF